MAPLRTYLEVKICGILEETTSSLDERDSVSPARQESVGNNIKTWQDWECVDPITKRPEYLAYRPNHVRGYVLFNKQVKLPAICLDTDCCVAQAVRRQKLLL